MAKIRNRRTALARKLGHAALAELLLNVSNRLGMSVDLTGALGAVVAMTTGAIGAERGAVFLNDANTGELFSRIAEGKFTREIRMINSMGVAGQVFGSGQGRIIHDAYADEHFNRNIDESTGFTTRNILCVPLRTLKGDLVGVAQLLNKIDGSFTQHDFDLLEVMIEQAAIAIEHHRTLEAVQRGRQNELEFLGIVSEISSELQLSPLLAKLIRAITKMLDADRSTLFLNDEKKNELFTEVGEGLGATQIRFPNDRGIAGMVFQSRQTINIPHAYADLRFNPSFDRTTGFFTRSILCVPVINKQGKAIGVTQVLNKRGGTFTAEDEARLKAFTSQISIGLENAKLFDDVQTIKNYNTAILESMSSAVLTLDEKRTVVTCNAAGMRLFKKEMAAIVKRPAEEFFTGPNSWILDLIQKVETHLIQTDTHPMRRGDDRQSTQEGVVDKEIIIDGATVSVNLNVLPLIGLTGNRIGSILMIEDISSEKRMKATMSRYMDATLADQLLKSDQAFLGGLSSTASVLFSDIRGFTTLSEELGAQETVALLNEYFTLMVDCIQREGGMLDKFIGDAIMAVFGTPTPHDNDEDRAVRAAISMLKTLEDFNAQRQAANKKPVLIGVGINTDQIVSGNIGSPKRMDYTVIGDGVNLASRLESACKQYGAKIIISEYTFERLRGTYRCREIDRTIVKGKTQPVGLYEILEYHTPDSFPNLAEVLGHFKYGQECYRSQKWDSALKAFAEALRLNPNDPVSRLYVERCNTLRDNPPGDDWNGVWHLKSK